MSMILSNMSMMIFVHAMYRVYWILGYDMASHPGMREVIQGRCDVCLRVATVGGGIVNIPLWSPLSAGYIKSGTIQWARQALDLELVDSSRLRGFEERIGRFLTSFLVDLRREGLERNIRRRPREWGASG
jgi:hypothetical protein